MFRKIAITLVSAGLFAAVGCSSSNNKKISAGVTDIQPTPAPVAYQPQPIQPVQPMVYDNPTTVTPIIDTPTKATSSATGGGRSYTVQKGDTLFKIARTQYGDASAVRKIKDANPGLNPDQIKAGQKITLP